jgi:hypothetical protein
VSLSLLQQLLADGVADFAGHQVPKLETNGLKHSRGNALRETVLLLSVLF